MYESINDLIQYYKNYRRLKKLKKGASQEVVGEGKKRKKKRRKKTDIGIKRKKGKGEGKVDG